MSTVRSLEREHQVDDIPLTLRTERRMLCSFSCMQYQVVNFTRSTADRLYQRLSHPTLHQQQYQIFIFRDGKYDKYHVRCSIMSAAEVRYGR